jgi:hypothetical protein
MYENVLKNIIRVTNGLTVSLAIMEDILARVMTETSTVTLG